MVIHAEQSFNSSLRRYLLPVTCYFILGTSTLSLYLSINQYT